MTPGVLALTSVIGSRQRSRLAAALLLNNAEPVPGIANANQNLDAYARFGYRVVPDEIGGFAGPLAGLHAEPRGRRASARGDRSVRFAVPALRSRRALEEHLAKTISPWRRPAISRIRCSRSCARTCSITSKRSCDRAAARSTPGTRRCKPSKWLRRRGRRLPQHQHARGARQGMTRILQTVSCLDGYDPDALRVDKAREAIRACLSPITATETSRSAHRPWAACSPRTSCRRSTCRRTTTRRWTATPCAFPT